VGEPWAAGTRKGPGTTLLKPETLQEPQKYRRRGCGWGIGRSCSFIPWLKTPATAYSLNGGQILVSGVAFGLVCDHLGVSTRALTLAISLLGLLTSTSGCLSLPCGHWYRPKSLELGVTVDLHAVVQLTESAETRSYSGLAVGANGTVVAWGIVSITALGYERFVETSFVGSANLRAIWVHEGNSWWVVGDAGTAAFSEDHGETWTPVALPTTADLHAIARVKSRYVVVGDDVVLDQAADGTWSEVAAPDGEWGQLRALFHQADRIYAVGLNGVIWSTADASGPWVAESSGTQADLFAVGGHEFRSGVPVVAVGAGGTVLVRKSGTWERARNNEHIDLLGYVIPYALGANGELFEVHSDGTLSRVGKKMRGTQAVALGWGVVAVGNGGAAFRMEQEICNVCSAN
jgi:hypothetical protein